MLPVNCLEGGDAEELDMELVSAFPKLADAGGYELLSSRQRTFTGADPSPPRRVHCHLFKGCRASSQDIHQAYTKKPLYGASRVYWSELLSPVYTMPKSGQIFLSSELSKTTTNRPSDV